MEVMLFAQTILMGVRQPEGVEEPEGLRMTHKHT